MKGGENRMSKEIDDLMAECARTKSFRNDASERPNLTEDLILMEKFLTEVDAGEVPKKFPLSGNGHDISVNHVFEFKCRRFCTRRGMWAIVDLDWTKRLANWIGERSVLEIMCGAGFLAKALRAHGVRVCASDNRKLKNLSAFNKMEDVTPIVYLEASRVVRESPNCDILLVSWPPYEDSALNQACDLWGTDRPIIYIGEGSGGCTADDEFHDNFEDHPNKWRKPIRIPQWEGIHDYAQIGYWTREISKIAQPTRSKKVDTENGRLLRKLNV